MEWAVYIVEDVFRPMIHVITVTILPVITPKGALA